VPSPEEVVRLDIHISWAGNPDIVLEVNPSSNPHPLTPLLHSPFCPLLFPCLPSSHAFHPLTPSPPSPSKVGYKGAPLVLELSAIQFKGKVRVELNPLVPTIPGFGAILCTFMEDPFVNFSFKVGTLDVMVRPSLRFSMPTHWIQSPQWLQSVLSTFDHRIPL
jgi:hypothetical protein